MDYRTFPGGRRLWGAPATLWLIMVCAVGLRLAVVLADGMGPASTDEAHWQSMGVAMAEHGLLARRAHTYRPPLYPLLLAATYRIAGVQPLAVFAWQSLLGAAMCALVWRIGLRLGGTQVGLLAAAGLAVYPLLVFFSRVIMAETLLVFLTLVSVLAALRFYARPGWRQALVLGSSCGLTALCKPIILAWPPLLLAVWAWRYRHRLQAAPASVRLQPGRSPWAELLHMGSRMAMVGVGAVAMLSAGSVRNHAMTGYWVPVSTNLGMNLLVGHEPGATGLYRDDADYLPMFRQLVHSEPNAVVADRLATRRMLGVMARHPWRTLGLAVRKTWYLWSPWVTGAAMGPGLLGLITSGPLLVLGLWGVWRLRRDSVGAVVGTLVVTFTVVHALVFAHTRFRLPVDAALMAPAAWIAQQLWRRGGMGR